DWPGSPVAPGRFRRAPCRAAGPTGHPMLETQRDPCEEPGAGDVPRRPVVGHGAERVPPVTGPQRDTGREEVPGVQVVAQEEEAMRVGGLLILVGPARPGSGPEPGSDH